MKKPVRHILEFGIQRIRWIDHLLDGVGQHSEILSLVVWLEVWFLHIDDSPQVPAELEEELVMF